MTGGMLRGLLGTLLVAVALSVLGGLGVAALLLRPPATDPETLCRLDAPVAAHTIVLVDATDRLEPRHRRKLRAVLAQERARLAQFDRFTVMKLNPRRPQEPQLLFSRCLPRAPTDANPLFENTRLAQRIWEQEFQGALDAATRTAQSGAGARTSPILASLRAIAADADFGAEIENRRVVVISDLLEHEPGAFSLYDAGADYSVWRTTSAPPDFSNVELRIVPLDRPEHGAAQAAALRSFWPVFFRETGARTVSIDPIA